MEPLPVFPNGVRQWKGVNAVVLQPEDGNRLGCELVPTRVKRHLVPPVDADCLGWRKGGGVRPLLHLAEIVGAGDHANAKASYYRGMVKDLEYVLVLRVESVEEITVTGPDAQKSFQGGDATGRAELYRLPDTYLGSFGFKTSLRYTVNERGAGLAAGSDKVSLKLHPGQRPKEFLASLLDISIRRGVDRSYPQALANQGEGPFGSQVGE
ncbi:MAG: hypothetical protein R3F62_31880 [Planctomycetota bacterium]